VLLAPNPFLPSLRKVRILLSSEDCDRRYFKEWARPGGADGVADDGAEVTVPAGDDATERAFEVVVDGDGGWFEKL
jgi:hypothetical protein